MFYIDNENKPDFPTEISANSRKQFDECPTKFYWGKLRRLEKPGGNVHLTFGGAIAEGLEKFRTAFYGDGKSVQDAYIEGLKAILIHWGDFEAPEGSKKTLASCVLAFDSYIQQYPPHEDPVKPYIGPDGRPAVEFTFAVPIPGTSHPQTGEPILYTGRFDMLADYNGMLMIEDDKTAGALGQSWKNQWHMSSQITGYLWAARQYGLDVQGAIIRGIGIYKSYFDHQMVVEHRSKWFINRWIQQLQRNVEQMKRAWEKGEFDMSLDAACHAYGGCPYLQLCGSPYPERWVQAEYEVRDEDPMM